MNTTYKYGVTPGSGVNREDMGRRKSPKGRAHGRDKVSKVMHEFKEGELHSGSKKGPVVKNRRQAIAIALSEARRSR